MWIKVDDRYKEHPKFAQVGSLGITLWLAGLAHCNHNTTDGFIPWATARSLATWEFLDPRVGSKQMTIGFNDGGNWTYVQSDYVIELLLAAGLWEKAEGGYRVHDYLKYQWSKKQIEAGRDHIRKVRSEAGKKGAEARRQQRLAGLSNRSSNKVDKPLPPLPVTRHLESNGSKEQLPTLDGTDSVTRARGTLTPIGDLLKQLVDKEELSGR